MIDDVMGSPRKLSVKKMRSSNATLIILSIIFLIIGAYFITASLITSWRDDSLLVLAIGIIVLVFTILFFVSPIFYRHILTPTKIIFRHGFLFKMQIFLDDIVSIEEIGDRSGMPMLGGLGVKYHRIDRRYSILRSRNGILKIRLRKPLTTGWMPFRKSVEEIIFDTIDSEELLRIANQTATRKD